MTSSTIDPPTTATPFRAPMTAIVLIAVVGAALIALRTMIPAVTALGVLLVTSPLLLVFLKAPLVTFDGVLITCTVAGTLVAATSVNVGFRLYPLDLLLVLAVVAAAAQAADQRAASPMLTAWLVTLALGLVGVAALVHGLRSGNPLPDALGTFRRMLVYPVASFWIFTTFLREQGALVRVRRLLLWCGALLCLLAAYRIAAGTGYAAEVYAGAGNATRYLSFTEVLGVIYGALLALTMSALATQPEKRWVAAAGFAVLTVAVIASNYRTAWVAYVGGIMLAGVILALRKPRAAFRFLLVGIGLIVAGVLVVLATPLGPLMLEKFSTVNLVQTGTWRLASWLKAFSVFRQHPWFGVGFGYQHRFLRPSADLQSIILNQGNDIHNDFLWLLVNTGLIGFAMLLLIWFALIKRGLRKARESSGLDESVVTIASLSQLAVIGLTASFQPTISLGAAGVTLGMIGAILANHAGPVLEPSHLSVPPRDAGSAAAC